MDIASIINQFLRPLGGTIIPAAIVAGLFFGYFYTRAIVPFTSIAYHVLIAGWVFIFTLFIFRLVAGDSGTAVWGWLGIAFLWLIFSIFIRVGLSFPRFDSIRERFKR